MTTFSADIDIDLDELAQAVQDNLDTDPIVDAVIESRDFENAVREAVEEAVDTGDAEDVLVTLAALVQRVVALENALAVASVSLAEPRAARAQVSPDPADLY